MCLLLSYVSCGRTLSGLHILKVKLVWLWCIEIDALVHPWSLNNITININFITIINLIFDTINILNTSAFTTTTLYSSQLHTHLQHLWHNGSHWPIIGRCPIMWTRMNRPIATPVVPIQTTKTKKQARALVPRWIKVNYLLLKLFNQLTQASRLIGYNNIYQSISIENLNRKKFTTVNQINAATHISQKSNIVLPRNSCVV